MVLLFISSIAFMGLYPFVVSAPEIYMNLFMISDFYLHHPPPRKPYFQASDGLLWTPIIIHINPHHHAFHAIPTVSVPIAPG